MATIGLDIGGATLKSCDAAGRARAVRFPLWKQPEKLAAGLSELLTGQPADRLAVTMTGELCDCFATRAEGVAHILASVAQAYPALADADRIRVWQTTAEFVPPEQAIQSPWQTGASNWLALGCWAARLTEGEPTLLIDIGSTTTDLLFIDNGTPKPLGRTDADRLATGELAYHGVERTPVCTIVSEVEIDGRRHSLMNEWFATTRDVYLVSGDLAAEPADTNTADGRPASMANAVARLARMIGLDGTCFSAGQALALARQAGAAQLQTLVAVARRLLLAHGVDRVGWLIGGEGEFLAHRLIDCLAPARDCRTTALGQHLGPTVSRVACAYAVAVLLDERNPPAVG